MPQPEESRRPSMGKQSKEIKLALPPPSTVLFGDLLYDAILKILFGRFDWHNRRAIHWTGILQVEVYIYIVLFAKCFHAS
ncbi:hypothetical protein [Nitrosovibrio sp. Nv4]|uniref:hypothetical protein n=1 Tax=Nitrosovibrio sp. Nv4 TaxID=1945880 RepID=UPI000BD9B308|nr:hypothetical protein [Nitrosovibrio sp. Nv4]SOD41645.1 hypothetical protein SAMN06298226_1947 [Nitrosovibrio sp. Nv4]